MHHAPGGARVGEFSSRPSNTSRRLRRELPRPQHTSRAARNAVSMTGELTSTPCTCLQLSPPLSGANPPPPPRYKRPPVSLSRQSTLRSEMSTSGKRRSCATRLGTPLEATGASPLFSPFSPPAPFLPLRYSVLFLIFLVRLCPNPSRSLR